MRLLDRLRGKDDEEEEGEVTEAERIEHEQDAEERRRAKARLEVLRAELDSVLARKR